MMNKESVSKETKKGLVEIIVNSAKENKLSKDLVSRVNYTLKGLEKDEKAVPKSTLKELVEDIIDFVNTPVAPLAPVEASAKPVLKKGGKTPASPMAEAPTPEKVEAPKKSLKKGAPAPAPEKTAEEAKKTVKKADAPKKAEPKVETADDLTKEDLPMAKIFPAEIDHNSLGKLKNCFGEFKTIKEIADAIESGREFIFATYWTKRHLKEFAYGQAHEVPVPKAGFPYDLDTLQIVYICDGTPQFYAISTFTEAMFKFKEEDLEYVESESPNGGGKFKLRYSAGLEYEIYELVDGAPAESTPEEKEEPKEEAPAPATEKVAPAKKSLKKGAK